MLRSVDGPLCEQTAPLQDGGVLQAGAVTAESQSAEVRTHRVTIHWRQKGRVISHEVPEGEYILQSFEKQGDPLPFSCRNGCCTSCAVRIQQGELDQQEAMGLSKELRAKGYGLLCVARAVGPLVAETQDEDEVYDLQFGRHFGRGKITRDIPLEELETWKE